MHILFFKKVLIILRQSTKHDFFFWLGVQFPLNLATSNHMCFYYKSYPKTPAKNPIQRRVLVSAWLPGDARKICYPFVFLLNAPPENTHKDPWQPFMSRNMLIETFLAYPIVHNKWPPSNKCPQLFSPKKKPNTFFHQICSIFLPKNIYFSPKYSYGMPYWCYFNWKKYYFTPKNQICSIFLPKNIYFLPNIHMECHTDAILIERKYYFTPKNQIFLIQNSTVIKAPFLKKKKNCTPGAFSTNNTVLWLSPLLGYSMWNAYNPCRQFGYSLLQWGHGLRIQMK